MTITINQTNLSKALALIGKAISTRSSMPILACVHMETEGDHLRLTGYNREFMIRLWLKAKIKEGMAICAPHKLLAEYINRQTGPIQLEVKQSNYTLSLVCGKSTATIRGQDPNDFPLPTTLKTLTVSTTIGASLLAEMISQVTFAASQDESRPTMMAVEIAIGSEENNLRMAAVDGYRLAVRSAIDPGYKAPIVLIPHQSLEVIPFLIKDAGQIENAAMRFDENCFSVDLDGDDRVFSRAQFLGDLIDAKYPDYSVIIPKSHKTTVIMDRAELLKACQTTMIFANIIKVEVGGGNQVSLRASSNELGESLIELPAQIDGPSLTINFDGKYLIEHLSHIPTEQIKIRFSQPTRPATIHPLDLEIGDYLHVIMPMSPPR